MTPDSLFSLEGKTALVTGGATGIGRMAAEALVSAGARVLIVSRKGDACAAAADEINRLQHPGTAEGFSGDVGSQEGIDALVGEIEARCPDGLHILMNNAGRTWGAPLGRFPYLAWNKVMSLNVTGVFHLTQALLPLLRKTASMDDPARVVNLASVMGEVPIGDGAYSYSASKAAVIHMTKILAVELAGEFITVNALAPGPFLSKMTAFAVGEEDKAAKVAGDVPLKRLGRKEDIGGCMLFLCGPGGGYVTGAVIPVSGGINVQVGSNIFEKAMD